MNTTAKSLLTVTAFFGAGVLAAWGDKAAEKGAVAEAAKIASLVQEVPSLKQNLRPFQTLVVRVVEEKFTDEKTWEHVRTSHITLDLKKNFLKVKVAENEGADRNELFYYDMSYFGKDITGFAGWVDKKESDFLAPKKIERPYGFIQEKESIGVFSRSRLSLLWFYYIETPMKVDGSGVIQVTPGKWILDLFQDSTILKSAKIIKQPNADEVHIQVEDFNRYVFSKSKGMIIKRIEGTQNPDGTYEEMGRMEIVDFINKDGWYFPRTIVQSANGKVYGRETVDVESVAINKPLLLSDFSITIPAGTKVLDEVKNANYVTARDITSMSVQSTEAQLKELLEKAKKDTK